MKPQSPGTTSDIDYGELLRLAFKLLTLATVHGGQIFPSPVQQYE